ncbi:MAG TPA: acyl-CoA dehydrogenase family protein [Acidimicrobiales bacterium]|jgi:alkylation response protein AidB-like acyl-CoA dehydrogenase|nr:acyl-CoA dehydrogenase family protein [Acidimicrobiales bacterium]
MQLDLTDDQSLFHQTTLRFIETELPLDQTRSLHDDPQGYTRSWLRKSGEIGWFAMLVPEAYGGGSVSGTGLLDAVIVSEELGRTMQPGPFIPMNIVASALASGGSDAMRSDVLPQIIAGEEVATWAHADGRGNWDDGSSLALERSGSGLRLSGTRGFVQDAVSADWLLVVATTDDGPVQALVRADDPGVHVRPLTCLDLSRRLADVDFDGVQVSPDAILDTAGSDLLEAQLLLAAVLVCADTVGAIDALLAMTVAYAKDRIAFGRPIGSFQALKHVLADQALYLETCKAGAVAAAKAVATGADNAPEIVSMVAAYIGDVSNELAQECLQVHGGIGYTWEHDLHLFLRRVRSNAVLYGEPTWHRERVCAFHDRSDGALR